MAVQCFTIGFIDILWKAFSEMDQPCNILEDSILFDLEWSQEDSFRKPRLTYLT